MGLYEDVGETKIYLDSKSDILARIFGWESGINSEVTSEIEVNGYLTDAMVLGKGIIGQGSWVMGAILHDPNIGRECLVYDNVGIPLKGLRMKDNQSLFRVKVIDKGRFNTVVCWRLTTDDPKKASVWGKSVIDMCKSAGTYERLEEIAEASDKRPEEITLWEAPLWPVLTDGDDVQEALGWMASAWDGSPTETYRRAKKLSMKLIMHQKKKHVVLPLQLHMLNMNHLSVIMHTLTAQVTLTT